jgi:thiosulfate dehydrogenase
VRVIFGIIIGLLIFPAAGWLYLRYGHLPVAITDSALPYEREITHQALNARIDKEKPTVVPIEANEATFIAGAQVYRQQCAFCHGVNGSPSDVGKHMFPDAPPLWEKHTGSDVVGVSDDPAGETYWKVANGIRLSGMPGYKGVLNETQMWQVSLLLANADKPLPPAALGYLKQPLDFNSSLPATK